MITREEIRSIPELYKSIQRDKEQLLYLQEKATSVPSTIPDHERVQTSPSNNGNKYVEEAVDRSREIKEKELKLAELQHRMRGLIASLPRETETDKLAVRILRLRYLKCYTWEEVAELTGYVERHVRRVEYEILEDVLPCPPTSVI